MYPPHLSYLKEKGTIWFNPAYGIGAFWGESRKLGEKLNKPFKEVWIHRDFKRAKEIYATSIIAMAMSKQDKKEFWIIKPKNDPPDGVIGTIIEKDGFQEMHVREIEVVEHIEGNLLDTIRKKLSDKRYEPNTILVCYISQGGGFDPEKEAKIISKEITSLDHIFLVFTGLRASDIPLNFESMDKKDLARVLLKISLVQIKPVFSFSTIDPIEDCKKLREGKEGAFYIFKGVGKGGTESITLENPPKLF